MLEFYNDKVCKARKSYKCELCGEEIAAGEQYHRQSGKYDGEFFDRCLHMTCNRMIEEYCRAEDEYEYEPENISDWLQERYCCECDEYEECNKICFNCQKITSNLNEGK